MEGHQRLGDRFDDDFTVLARNVRDPAVLRELNGWAKANEATIALIDKQAGFVKLSRKSEANPISDNLPGVRDLSAPPPRQSSGRPAASA